MRRKHKSSLYSNARNNEGRLDPAAVSAACRHLREETLEAVAQMSDNIDDLCALDVPETLERWIFAKEFAAAFVAKLQRQR